MAEINSKNHVVQMIEGLDEAETMICFHLLLQRLSGGSKFDPENERDDTSLDSIDHPNAMGEITQILKSSG